MSELLSILRHSTNRLAKRWRADGSIEPYDDAKYFVFNPRKVSGIRHLSALFSKLEKKEGMCLVRGQYIGDEAAATADPEYKSGKVRRVLAVFEDRPLHTCLIEVDTFEPFMGDPVTEPEACIEEYILSMLPECFHEISYHWQLSNSAGAPGNEDKLKVHIWFWLETPYTSAQMRAWAKTLPVDTLDASVFNPVQVHYTSAPVFADGVENPVPRRSGFVDGLLDDAVPLEIDEAAIAAAQAQDGKTTRQATLRNAIDTDPVVHLLDEKGMVKSQGTSGQLFIDCPCSEDHSSEGGPTSTVYYPPNTGGYAKGAFVCLHDHCRERPQREFQLALGYDDILDEFTDLDEGVTYDAYAVEGDLLPEIKMKDIPEAKHLTTDLKNAERIMKKFKKRLLVSTDQWYAWTGTHWAQDEGEVYVAAVKLSKIIHAEADEWEHDALTICEARIGGGLTLKWLRSQMETPKLMNELPGKAASKMMVADALKKWALRSEMKGTIEAALGLARKMLAVPADKLNGDPWAFNCLNGTIDLRTGELRRHNPNDYITHCAPLAYNPAAHSALWELTLDKITQAEKHGPVGTEFLKRWFGYCATGSTREQKFVVHYGNGRNGKSTVLDLVAEVLNGYAGTAAPGLLSGKSNDRHPTEIADLFGRRMVTAHESDEGAILREGFVKQATGSDKLKARLMRADFFEFAPTHKLQLLTNHKPVVKGQDAGIWGRVLLMPYLASFGSAAEMKAGLRTALVDKTLVERLQAERQGILTWIVEGAVEWYRDGLSPPDYVLAASQGYKEEQDRILQFITECCIVGEEHCVPLAGVFGGLYPAYKEWCSDGGFRPLAKNRMLDEVTRVVPNCETRSVLRTDEFEKRRRILQVEGLKLLDDD